MSGVNKAAENLTVGASCAKGATALPVTLRTMIAAAAISACVVIEIFLTRAVLEAGFLPNAWCIGS